MKIIKFSLVIFLLFVSNINAKAQALDTVTYRHAFIGFYGSAILDFPTVSAGGNYELTIYVPNARVGNPVLLGIGSPFSTMPSTNVLYSAYVSSPDIVTVRFSNLDKGTWQVNPAAALFRVRVFMSVGGEDDLLYQ